MPQLYLFEVEFMDLFIVRPCWHAKSGGMATAIHYGEVMKIG